MKFNLRISFFRPLVFGVGLLFSLVSGPLPFARADWQAVDPNTDGLHYADLVVAASGSDEIIVWEGLPHPLSEKKALASELATKKTFQIQHLDFYALPLTVGDESKRLISEAVLKAKGHFKPWSGMKLCGGFHADYAVEWRLKGKTLAQSLFCFTCHEAIFVVGDKTETVDQSDAGHTVFRQLFLTYRQQRPMAVPPSAGPVR